VATDTLERRQQEEADMEGSVIPGKDAAKPPHSKVKYSVVALAIILLLVALGMFASLTLLSTRMGPDESPPVASVEEPDPMLPPLTRAETGELSLSIGRSPASEGRVTGHPPGGAAGEARIAPIAPAPLEDEQELRLVRAREDATADGAPQKMQGMAWNYWLAGGEGGPRPAPLLGRLEVDVERRLAFRLSHFDLAHAFPDVKSLAGTPELVLAIKNGLSDAERPSLTLDILVHSVDASRVRIAPQSQRMALTVDLEAMRRTLTDPAMRLRAGDPPDALLLAATIAQFDVGFTPLAAGTHDIGISLIDAATGFPLQTMIVTLAVGADWPASVSVQTSGKAIAAQSGAAVDLGLQLMELVSDTNGELKRNLHARLSFVEPGAARRSYIEWEPNLDMESVLDGFKTFRSTVGALSSGQQLLDAGYDAGRQLFDPVPAEGMLCTQDPQCRSAARARQIIVERATYPAGALPPSMEVKLVKKDEQRRGANGRAPPEEHLSHVLPIGALGISTGGPEQAVYLGERFALALLVNGQTPSADRPCPQRWYVALPDRKLIEPLTNQPALNAAIVSLAPLMQAHSGAAFLQPQAMDLGQLKTWLREPATAYPDEPFVLAYLGHHEGGRLFLNFKGKGVEFSHVRRRFGGNSIAILNACNSALDHVSRGTLIGSLSALKVAATIATTSAIDGEVAGAYLVCLDQVLAARTGLTVGQAHALATQCLWSKDRSSGVYRYDYLGAALKYVLIGNPHQRMCAPSKETSP
jgi:hypothetical protein